CASVLERCLILRSLPSFPTRRSSDLGADARPLSCAGSAADRAWSLCRQQPGSAADRVDYRTDRLPGWAAARRLGGHGGLGSADRSEEHTSELQSREKLVCRLLPEKKD